MPADSSVAPIDSSATRRDADEPAAAPADSADTRREADEYWQYVERIAKQVDAWPDWKKGEWLSVEEKPVEK